MKTNFYPNKQLDIFVGGYPGEVENGQPLSVKKHIEVDEHKEIPLMRKIKDYVLSLDTPDNEIYQANSLLIMSCFSKALEFIEQDSQPKVKVDSWDKIVSSFEDFYHPQKITLEQIELINWLKSNYSLTKL